MIGPPADLTETPEDGKSDMDALSDVLRVAQLSSGVFVNAEFTDPWCLETSVTPEACAPFLGPVDHIILYHYVVDGPMRVKLGDAPPISVNGGEIFMFPRNAPHLIGGDLDLPPAYAPDHICESADGGLCTITLGDGQGPRVRAICGFLGCRDIGGNPVLESLPEMLHLPVAAGRSADWLRSTFHYAAGELADGRSGCETVMAKLSELLFVEAVRRYADDLPADQAGWLAGLRDPYVARALTLLHAQVERAWTVDDLGREVGLSRSALAERFARTIGEPPMQYLTRWRLQLAARDLRRSDAPLARIAEGVGYDSEAAFSRAFKRGFGLPPATWRRQASEAAPAAL